MRQQISWALLVFTLFTSLLCLADDQVGRAGATGPALSSTNATAVPPTTPKVTAYTLPPELYRKARDRSRILFRLSLIGFVYGLLVLWLILRWKLSAKYRDWAEQSSSRHYARIVDRS